jgi:hypothetical protein
VRTRKSSKLHSKLPDCYRLPRSPMEVSLALLTSTVLVRPDTPRPR